MWTHHLGPGADDGQDHHRAGQHAPYTTLAVALEFTNGAVGASSSMSPPDLTPSHTSDWYTPLPSYEKPLTTTVATTIRARRSGVCIVVEVCQAYAIDIDVDRVNPGTLKGFAVQVSFDSSEPLIDVLPVLETMYGVQLGLVGDGSTVGASSSTTAAGRTVSKVAVRRSPRAGAQATGSRTARTGKAAPSVAEGASAAGSAGLAQRVRAWARENGVEVSGRGRLPQSTVDAYSAAQP